MVVTITKLVNEGYPEHQIRQIARSQFFDLVGFTTGKKRKTYYFYKDKLDEFLKKGVMQWN